VTEAGEYQSYNKVNVCMFDCFCATQIHHMQTQCFSVSQH